MFRCKGYLFHANQELPMADKVHFKLDGAIRFMYTPILYHFLLFLSRGFPHSKTMATNRIEWSNDKKAYLKWKNTTVIVVPEEATFKTIIIIAYKHLLVAID